MTVKTDGARETDWTNGCAEHLTPPDTGTRICLQNSETGRWNIKGTIEEVRRDGRTYWVTINGHPGMRVVSCAHLRVSDAVFRHGVTAPTRTDAALKETLGYNLCVKHPLYYVIWMVVGIATIWWMITQE